jgi:hypothetical protein
MDTSSRFALLQIRIHANRVMEPLRKCMCV